MNSKFLFSIFILIISIIFFSGCFGIEEEIILPTEVLPPSATSIPARTSIPSATITPIPSPTPTPTQTSTPLPPKEIPVQEIPLSGPITSPKAQISGMAWYGDTLVILPQYPEKVIPGAGGSAAFSLSKQEILDYLSGSIPGPLIPHQITFRAPDLAGLFPGYEGYEAIAFDDDQVFLTVESNHQGTMQGFLISGEYNPNLNRITLNSESLTEIPLPIQIFNYAYETIVITNDQALTIYEANGNDLNPNPSAFSIARSSLIPDKYDFSNIEYRLTDATDIGKNGRFWVMNIFMPIEFWLYTDSDPLFEKYGRGKTHTEFLNVERVLELQYDGESFSLTDREPVQLELIDEVNSRNWEALVKLDELGFLAMTDTYPETILGFIPFPD